MISWEWICDIIHKYAGYDGLDIDEFENVAKDVADEINKYGYDDSALPILDEYDCKMNETNMRPENLSGEDPIRYCPFCGKEYEQKGE